MKPREVRRLYVPTWWERRFPWMLDLLAALDPEPVYRHRIAPILAPMGHLVQAATLPLAAALDILGKWVHDVSAAVSRRLGAVLSALPTPGPIRRSLWLEPVEDAPAALKRQDATVLPLSLMLAAATHMAVIVFSPTITVAVPPAPSGHVTAVEIPPDVEVPPPPAHIVRPAAPVLDGATIDEDITISPTTFEAYTPVDLPPPPPEVTENARSEPGFTPFTVPPRMLNAEEIAKLMEREYPPLLRKAGIGGTIVVWAYVNLDGSVDEIRVDRSSGHDELDAAALRVAARIQCSPGLNGDVPVPVWIRLPLEFEVR